MDKTVSPDELLDDLESLDIEVPDKDVTIASTDTEQNLNLNAVSIGLGLESVKYSPEEFPGLIYLPGDYDKTVVVLFGHGTFFIVSPSPVEVQEIVDVVINKIQDLGLFDETTSPDVFESPEEIQVPESYGESDESEQSETDISCPSCGSDLSGSENYCAECGEELSMLCPSCGNKLSGEENYCPECGANLSE